MSSLDWNCLSAGAGQGDARRDSFEDTDGDYGLDRAFSTAGAEDSKTMAVDICQSVGGLLIREF
jgi:hypothetical protein